MPNCKKNCICCNIEVTSERFLYLAENSQLKKCQTYKITDIQNGLYVETLTNSTFKSEATLSFLAPDYTLHAQYHSTDGAIANGATVTWGGFYWTNISGGAVTPNVPDEVDLDNTGAFTKITKSTANGYVQVVISVVVNTSLDILEVTDNYNNTVNNFLLSFFGLSYENTMINNDGVQFNDGWAITNCKPSSPFSISFNKSISTPIIKRCLDGIYNNEGIGTLDVVYIENSNAIFGQHLHLSYIKNVSIVGGRTINESEFNNLSYAENISITGDGNFMASGDLDSSSFEKNITIAGNRNEFNTRRFIQDSGIDNWNINADDFIFNNVTLENASVLSNFTTATNGRQIKAFSVSGLNIDFTGFDRNIVGESIIDGFGNFTITHDFSANPLTTGNSVLYNLIPNGARLTNCTIIPDPLSGGAGATLQIGLETDDVSYGIAPTALGSVVNTVVNTVSNVATAHRSLQLTAGVNDITGGSVTVKIEFVL